MSLSSTSSSPVSSPSKIRKEALQQTHGGALLFAAEQTKQRSATLQFCVQLTTFGDLSRPKLDQRERFKRFLFNENESDEFVLDSLLRSVKSSLLTQRCDCCTHALRQDLDLEQNISNLDLFLQIQPEFGPRKRVGEPRFDRTAAEALSCSSSLSWQRLPYELVIYMFSWLECTFTFDSKSNSMCSKAHDIIGRFKRDPVRKWYALFRTAQLCDGFVGRGMTPISKTQFRFCMKHVQNLSLHLVYERGEGTGACLVQLLSRLQMPLLRSVRLQNWPQPWLLQSDSLSYLMRRVVEYSTANYPPRDIHALSHLLNLFSSRIEVVRAVKHRLERDDIARLQQQNGSNMRSLSCRVTNPQTLHHLFDNMHSTLLTQCYVWLDTRTAAPLRNEWFMNRQSQVAPSSLRKLILQSQHATNTDQAIQIPSAHCFVQMCPRLSHLVIKGVELQSLEGISQLKHLEFLVVHLSGSSEIRGISELLDLRQLRRIGLIGHGKLSQQLQKTIAQMSSSGQLTGLELRGISGQPLCISNQELNEMVCDQPCSQLETLVLLHTRGLTKDCLVDLVQQHGPKRLRQVTVEGENVHLSTSNCEQLKKRFGVTVTDYLDPWRTLHQL